MSRLLPFLALAGALALGDSDGGLVNTTGPARIAVSGLDPVAFFTDAKAVHGSPQFSAMHDGATYFFASEEHQRLFVAKPESYLPQFGGYCAYGVAIDRLLPVDVTTWQVRDGRLYLNLNAEVLKGFNADFDALVAKAQKNWPELVKRQAHAPTGAGGDSRAAPSKVNVAGVSGVALSGFDPVAFFTDAKAVNGSPQFSATHDGAAYFFASEEHRQLFLAKPQSYLPQFGGFCAYGVAAGHLVPVDISTWQVRNGRLYLNFDAEVLKLFNADFDALVGTAEKNWPALATGSVR
jgi:YHS domain-containing protein